MKLSWQSKKYKQRRETPHKKLLSLSLPLHHLLKLKKKKKGAISSVSWISSTIWKKTRSISSKADKTPTISERDSGYRSKQHNVQRSKTRRLFARELSLTRTCWPASSSSSYWAPGEFPGLRVPLFSFFVCFFP
jgi:hypothetical protein